MNQVASLLALEYVLTHTANSPRDHRFNSILTDICICVSVKLESMRATALQIIDCLRERSYAVGELADTISENQSWTSEVVKNLEDDNFIDRVDGVRLATPYEAMLLADLLGRYALENVLTGIKKRSWVRFSMG